jgi:hypothetical protein
MATLHRRYQDYRCWQCISYPRGLDEVVPPPKDERRGCLKLFDRGAKSAYSPICSSGVLDKERWRIAQERMANAQASKGIDSVPASPVEVLRPSLVTFPDAVQRCVHATRPESAFYVRTSCTGLSDPEIEELVTLGYLRRYERKPRGHIYRLSGKYHYLVPRE